MGTTAKPHSLALSGVKKMGQVIEQLAPYRIVAELNEVAKSASKVSNRFSARLTTTDGTRRGLACHLNIGRVVADQDLVASALDAEFFSELDREVFD